MDYFFRCFDIKNFSGHMEDYHSMSVDLIISLVMVGPNVEVVDGIIENKFSHQIWKAENRCSKVLLQRNLNDSLIKQLPCQLVSLIIIPGALESVSSDFLCIYCTLSEISSQLVGNALFILSVKFLQGFQPNYLEYLSIYLLCTLQKKMCCHL